MSEPKLRCARCGGETRHTIAGGFQSTTTDDGSGVVIWEHYRVARCMGCDQVVFWYQTSNNEDLDDTGHPEEYNTFFSGSYGVRFPIAQSRLLPNNVRRVYLETLDAINRGSGLMASTGLRGIVEAVCQEQGLTELRDLQKRIDALAERRLLLPSQAEVLHLHREAGNRAAHEFRAADVDELAGLLDIVEAVLIGLYILPHQAEAVRSRQSRKLDISLTRVWRSNKEAWALLSVMAADPEPSVYRSVDDWAIRAGMESNQAEASIRWVLARYDADHSEVQILSEHRNGSGIIYRVVDAAIEKINKDDDW